MRIYEVQDKKRYLPLLLIGDEQESMIDRYLDDCRMYVLDAGGVRGEIAVCELPDGVLEIKNLAVEPSHRRKGLGRALIEYVCERYRDRCAIVQVGTGNSPGTLGFYRKCGFEFSHVVQNFFVDHYDHPIVEDGVTLVDMIYLRKAIGR